MILIIAIIMTATYTCNAIIYPDDTTNYLSNYDQFGGIQGKEISFQVWLDLNFYNAYLHIFNGVEIKNKVSFSLVTYEYIDSHYKDSMSGWGEKLPQGIFDEFEHNKENAGWRWYNSDWVQTTPFLSLENLLGTTKTERITDDYHKYLQDIGVEEKPQGNLLDTITLLLTNVWEGFTQLVRLLTFTNIPNLPLWVLGLLNVFFIPMWIVLIIGIAPFVMDIIKTISSIIEPWIPW